MFGNFFTNLRPSSSSAACLSGHGHQPVTVPSLTASVSEKGGICILFRIRHLGPAMPCLTPVFNICEFCPCLCSFFLRIFAFRSTAARLLSRSRGQCNHSSCNKKRKGSPRNLGNSILGHSRALIALRILCFHPTTFLLCILRLTVPLSRLGAYTLTYAYRLPLDKCAARQYYSNDN